MVLLTICEFSSPLLNPYPTSISLYRILQATPYRWRDRAIGSRSLTSEDTRQGKTRGTASVGLHPNSCRMVNQSGTKRNVSASTPQTPRPSLFSIYLEHLRHHRRGRSQNIANCAHEPEHLFLIGDFAHITPWTAQMILSIFLPHFAFAICHFAFEGECLWSLVIPAGVIHNHPELAHLLPQTSPNHLSLQYIAHRGYPAPELAHLCPIHNRPQPSHLLISVF